MGEVDEQIKAAFKRIAKADGPDIIFEGTITDVDDEAYTADVEIDNDGGTIFDVRLRAVASGSKSIDVLPAIGAEVVLAKISDDEFIILACDEITEYRLTIGNTVYKVDSTGHEISKGNESLKKVLNDLVDVILTIGAFKDTATLTLIKQRLNNLLK